MLVQSGSNQSVFCRLFFILVLICSSNHLVAGVSHDTSLDWYSLESEHFIIHYHTGLEPVARKSLAISERVHERLSKWIKWQPESKTNIMLTDEYDFSNGYATPFPSNRFAVFLSSPDNLNSIEDNASWLETVITHEYLHVLHLDKAIGPALTMRRILGRHPLPIFNTFPNAFQPRWMIEGVATYIETDKERGVGRGQSTYFDMMMRMEVKDGFKPVRQVNQGWITEWPMGTSWYLYGVHFFNFIEATRGEYKIPFWIDNYSNNLFGYINDSNAEQSWDADLSTLWDQFEKHLQKKYRPQWEAITKQGLIEGDKLTEHGYFAGSLRVSRDERAFYSAYNANRKPGLMVIKPGAKEPEYFEKVEFDTRLDLHPTAGLLLTKTDTCANAKVYYDVYIVNPDDGDETRITSCGRYRMATWSPDGKTIAAVKNHQAINELQLLDLDGKVIDTLWKGQAEETISYLDWSPTADIIVAAVFRADKGWNLEQFDIKTRSWSFITNDNAIATQPVFSADGKYVYFSSDHGGVYNIRRYDVASKQIVSLTNVIGGAFHPAVTADQKTLYYIGYTNKGFDVFRLALDTTSAQPALPKAEQTSTGVAQAEPEPAKTSEVEDYSPWQTVVPRYYLPVLFFDDTVSVAGASTSGSDILNRHNYFLGGAYDFKNDEFLGSVDYVYDRWWPVFKYHWSRDYSVSLDNEDKVIRLRTEDLNLAEIVLPFIGANYRLSFHLGAYKEKEKDSFVETGYASVGPYQDNVVGLAAVFTNTNFHIRGISTTEGRRIMLVAEDSDRLGNSNFSGKVYTADWREYIRLGGSHVLALRAVDGHGTGPNPRQFRLGGQTDTYFEPRLLDGALVNSPFNRRDYALRGYNEGNSQLVGKRMRIYSGEYRFPIWRLERGAMLPIAPIGLHQLSGNIFYDSGAVWNNGSPNKHYDGAGGELIADVIMFYDVAVRVTLGYAHGFDDTIGDDIVYLRFGSAF